MKKSVIKSSILLLVLASIIIFSFNGCKEEPTECTAVITVKMQSDTLLVVPFADLTIEWGDVLVNGKSDASGMFQYVFKYEAILDVTAVKDTNTAPPDDDDLIGEGIIRLRPGETVYKSIFIR